MIKPGQIYRPNDPRRNNRRIRVVYFDKRYQYDYPGCKPRTIRIVGVESRLVGERKWKPAPAIRLDRLESRAYKLVKGV